MFYFLVQAYLMPKLDDTQMCTVAESVLVTCDCNAQCEEKFSKWNNQSYHL